MEKNYLDQHHCELNVDMYAYRKGKKTYDIVSSLFYLHCTKKKTKTKTKDKKTNQNKQLLKS